MLFCRGIRAPFKLSLILLLFALLATQRNTDS